MLGKRATTLLAFAFVGACVLVAVLALQQRSLKRAYGQLRLSAVFPHRGYVVPTVHSTTLTGDSITIGELGDSADKQLVFLLTTTCPVCQATLPIWAQLADSAARMERVEVVAIGLDSLASIRRYAGRNGLKYPVSTFPDWKLATHFRAQMVPQTLVLNWLGQVLYAHTGPLSLGPIVDSVYEALRGPPRIAPVGAVVNSRSKSGESR